MGLKYLLLCGLCPNFKNRRLSLLLLLCVNATNVLIAFTLCCCKSPIFYTRVKQIIEVWLDIVLPGLPPKILTSKVQVGLGICIAKNTAHFSQVCPLAYTLCYKILRKNPSQSTVALCNGVCMFWLQEGWRGCLIVLHGNHQTFDFCSKRRKS